MIDQAEKAAADYLLGLSPDDREAAERRINQLLRVSLPADDLSLRPPIRTLGDYLGSKIEVPPFLISGGQLVRGEITATIARAGKGKTTLGMNRMVRWAAGAPLFDELKDSQAPFEPVKILMIENEGVASFMQEKLSLLLHTGAELNPDQVRLAEENLLVWGDGGYSGLKVDADADLELIRMGCEEWSPDAILLEPFRGIWTGDENDSSAMESVLDRLNALAHDYDLGIMLAHHENKSGGGDTGEWMNASRGSTVLEAKCAIMENYRAVKAGAYRELSWSKNRFDTSGAPIRMYFDRERWRMVMVPLDEVEQSVLNLMSEDVGGWFWVNEMAEQLDEPERKIRDAVAKLVEEERVVKKKGTDERRGYRFRLRTGDAGSDERPGLDIT